eukprot:403357057
MKGKEVIVFQKDKTTKLSQQILVPISLKETHIQSISYKSSLLETISDSQNLRIKREESFNGKRRIVLNKKSPNIVSQISTGQQDKPLNPNQSSKIYSNVDIQSSKNTPQESLAQSGNLNIHDLGLKPIQLKSTKLLKNFPEDFFSNRSRSSKLKILQLQQHAKFQNGGINSIVCENLFASQIQSSNDIKHINQPKILRIRSEGNILRPYNSDLLQISLQKSQIEEEALMDKMLLTSEGIQHQLKYQYNSILDKKLQSPKRQTNQELQLEHVNDKAQTGNIQNQNQDRLFKKYRDDLIVNKNHEQYADILNGLKLSKFHTEQNQQQDQQLYRNQIYSSQQQSQINQQPFFRKRLAQGAEQNIQINLAGLKHKKSTHSGLRRSKSFQILPSNCQKDLNLNSSIIKGPDICNKLQQQESRYSNHKSYFSSFIENDQSKSRQKQNGIQQKEDNKFTEYQMNIKVQEKQKRCGSQKDLFNQHQYQNIDFSQLIQKMQNSNSRQELQSQQQTQKNQKLKKLKEIERHASTPQNDSSRQLILDDQIDYSTYQSNQNYVKAPNHQIQTQLQSLQSSLNSSKLKIKLRRNSRNKNINESLISSKKQDDSQINPAQNIQESLSLNDQLKLLTQNQQRCQTTRNQEFKSRNLNTYLYNQKNVQISQQIQGIPQESILQQADLQHQNSKTSFLQRFQSVQSLANTNLGNIHESNNQQQDMIPPRRKTQRKIILMANIQKKNNNSLSSSISNQEQITSRFSNVQAKPKTVQDDIKFTNLDLQLVNKQLSNQLNIQKQLTAFSDTPKSISDNGGVSTAADNTAFLMRMSMSRESTEFAQRVANFHSNLTSLQVSQRPSLRKITDSQIIPEAVEFQFANEDQELIFEDALDNQHIMESKNSEINQIFGLTFGKSLMQ